MTKLQLSGQLILAGILAVAGLVINSTVAQAITPADIKVTIDDSTSTKGNIVINNITESVLRIDYAIGTPANDCRAGDAFSLKMIEEGGLSNPVRADFTKSTSSTRYCFKITNRSKNPEEVTWYSYPADQSSPSTPPATPTPVVAAVPVIKVERVRNNTLAVTSVATNLNANTWRLAKLTGQDKQTYQNDCTKIPASRYTNRLVTPQSRQVTLTEDDNGRWYCFRVTDNNNQIGYTSYTITNVDTTAPSLNIQQNTRILRADADETPLQNWSYVVSRTDPDCDADDFVNNRSLVRSQRVTLTADQIGSYYCFRAADTAGNYGYTKYKVESVDFSTPKITLQQNGLEVLVESDQELQTVQSLKTETDLPCNSETDFKTATSEMIGLPIEVVSADHQQYLCVRGVNATNASGYQRIKLDTHIEPISLNINQEESFITATISETENDTITWAYLKTEQAIPCDATDDNQFDIEPFVGNTSQLNNLDNGIFFCFRATDKANNRSYAKVQIGGITKLAPNEGGGRLSLEIIILMIVAGGGIAGFMIYYILEQKKKVIPQADEIQSPEANFDTISPITPTPDATNNNQPGAEPTPPHQDSQSTDNQLPPFKDTQSSVDIVQPLDYLKNQDEEE